MKSVMIKVIMKCNKRLGVLEKEDNVSMYKSAVATDTTQKARLLKQASENGVGEI